MRKIVICKYLGMFSNRRNMKELFFDDDYYNVLAIFDFIIYFHCQNTMIIEYIGSLIRNEVANKRERIYENSVSIDYTL